MEKQRIFEYLCSFFMPLGILGLAYIKLGMYPAGDHTVLISDLSGQYIDFYSTYYEILTKGQSILYSWQAGMGLNFLGLFAYYLSSPFSLFILLFPKEHLTEAVMLIILLKIGCSGFTFLYYARYSLKCTGIYRILFSVLYSLMSYSIVYSFNLMWLDGVILLPLVLFGVEKILRENKFLFFALSLIVIFIANFYIAYMVGVFSFLYMLAAFFSEHSGKGINFFFKKISLYGFSFLLAAGCSAILLVPTFFALTNGQGGPNVLSLLNWNINFKVLDLLSKSQLGAYDTLKYKGLPNIFCGLLPLLLTTVYFWNPKIPSKERIIYAILLGFLILSFNFSNLDIMWHAFDKPDWFPYRYSFVFSFLLIFLAAKSLQSMKLSEISLIKKTCPAWILVIFIVQKANYDFLSDRMIWISIVLLGLDSFLLAGILKSSINKKKFLICLAGLIFLETTLNTWYLLKRLDNEFSFVTKQEYGKTLAELQEIIPEIETKDQSFYRLDRIGGRTYNDPMNLYYPGITHFSSMSNQEMLKALRQLGFLTTAGYKSVNFAGSTPITESLFAVKYVISTTEKGLGYKEIMDKGEFKVYQNQYFLPVGFLVDKATLAFDPTKDDNPFTLQNRLINLMLGNKEPQIIDYFLPLPVQDTKMNNAALTFEKNKETFKRISNTQPGSVEFLLRNPKEQQVYVSFQTIDNDVQISINEKEIKGYLPVYNKRIVDLGFHQKNEELRVKLTFKNEGFALAQKYFYGLDENSLDQALSPLRQEAPDDFIVSDTRVQGNVHVSDRTLLFTSVPFDPGWEVTVNGQAASMRKIGEAFLGVELPPGENQISFEFYPYGFRVGTYISGISLGLFFLLLLHDLRKRKRKKASY
ncbi:MAG: YfhO family protein [Peptococcaceae bacterium]|nr:YfhO family protein [Peptococcaceae bacterium]